MFGERRWKPGHPIKLKHYASGAWDEAIDCPSYRSLEIEARVRARIDALAAADGVDYTCPIEPDACVAAGKRYGGFAPRLLHSACLAAEPARKPWWKLW